MSLRTRTATALIATAFVAVPAAASARPSPEELRAGPPVAAPSSQADGSPVDVVRPTILRASDGVGTLTVLAVAGGTLLVGAAGGLGGSLVLTRRTGGYSAR
jgi:hypothetical protein